MYDPVNTARDKRGVWKRVALGKKSTPYEISDGQNVVTVLLVTVAEPWHCRRQEIQASDDSLTTR